jgi:hypothetical protein
MTAQHEVIHSGHVREKFDVLKCPRNSLFGNLVGPQLGNGFSLEEDLSRIRLVNSADAIEDGGFPSPIGSDDGINGPFLHFEADITQRSDSAKRDGEIFNFENRFHSLMRKLIRVGEALASLLMGDPAYRQAGKVAPTHSYLQSFFALCAMPWSLRLLATL